MANLHFFMSCLMLACVLGHAEKYHMPYGGMVPNDPTFEEMRHVVVTQKRRPPIPSDWANDKVWEYIWLLLTDLSKLIRLHVTIAYPYLRRNTCGTLEALGDIE